MGNFSRGGFGGPQPTRQRATEERRDGRTAIEELRRRFDVRFQQKREEGAKRQPDPKIVAPIQPRSTEGMRRVVSTGAGAPAKSRYAVGDRVEHPKFGVGIVTRIDAAGEDNKLAINFESYGEKMLMERFAKLEKL